MVSQWPQGAWVVACFTDRNIEAQELLFHIALWTKWTLLLLETTTNLGLKKILNAPWDGENRRSVRAGCEWRWGPREISRGLKLVFALGTCVEPGEGENRFYISREQCIRGHSSGPAPDEKLVLKLGVQEGTPSCERGLKINAPLPRLRGKTSVLDCGAGWEGKWSFLWESVDKEGL